MCVQYLTTVNVDWVKTHFDLDLPTSTVHDVFPTYPGPIILKSHNTDRTAIGLARFGLLPSWAKEETFGRKTYSARAETVAEKPSYKFAWTKRHYALALADAFYEPCYESGKAVRTTIKQANQEPMAIASIWDTWTESETGELIVSFSMLTINASNHPVMQRMHKPEDEKRTVVPLRPELFDAWLNATPEEAQALLTIDSIPKLTLA
ncbi:SOS response-associated peptidase [Polynucleobacter sp. AP-Kaivos-20-H2]|uniref:SOS response-associated peptidase n=1 Tax=Polynucleobacter sp. AP-Kaivos-20-H2 TaxID=2689104 RepID=UPI001C0CDCB6|nr:SOS response-associated peptidase family protein [Polynucleobacter sp. AP-Kaivos-20-H2]MBU3604021.1 SOS response-associated peptidase family protein [Polynucleobacter sp. AP-Kaivos-20-H2]